MSNKFEWRGHNKSSQLTLWLGAVPLGSVAVHGDEVAAWFGEGDRAETEFWPGDPVDEAKAWVEEQARAWLAEVSREQRLLTLANAFSEAYAKAMADQGNTQAWLKVHEAWCAYDDARKEVTD